MLLFVGNNTGILFLKTAIIEEILPEIIGGGFVSLKPPFRPILTNRIEVPKEKKEIEVFVELLLYKIIVDAFLKGS